MCSVLITVPNNKVHKLIHIFLKNLAAPSHSIALDTYSLNEWGFKGACYCREDGHSNCNASCSMRKETWQTMSTSNWFLLFRPVIYVAETMIPTMNDTLEKEDQR